MAGSRTFILVAILSLLALAGCQTTVPARLDLPAVSALDRRMTDPDFCGRGDAKAGDHAVAAIRRKENARGCEAGRSAAWVTFYGRLAAERAK